MDLIQTIRQYILNLEVKRRHQFAGLASCVVLLMLVACIASDQSREANRFAQAAGEVSSELENGTVFNPAVVESDVRASGGSHVKFRGVSSQSPGLFGMSGGDLPGVSATERNRFLDDYKAMGVEWVRFDFLWWDIQREGPKSFDWAKYDATVKALNRKGFRILGILTYSPQWARSSYCSSSYQCAPADVRDFAKFARAAAKRYAPMGVHYWEIWNEPNLGAFTNVAHYTNMLKASYTAIKEVDSSAFLLAGGSNGTFTQGDRISSEDFLQGIYQNGGKDYFDAVAHHPYCYYPNLDCPTQFARWSGWSRMNDTNPSLRSIMIANGDSAKKIWATEFGAPTGGDPEAVSKARQAQMVTDAYKLWKSYNWAGGPLFWYNYWDYCTDATLECYFGLRENDLSPKPAYYKYKNMATGQ
jgi:polysaccharide biosynthesis protein PslG